MKRKLKHGMELALKEHLLAGNTVTQLEAIILFGIANLTVAIHRIRKEGWIVEAQKVPYAKAVNRVNECSLFEPPKNLPVREIFLTEYWINR